jgi:hypothetical protein
MATATLAPTGAQADAKATVIKVRNAASVKLDYLRSLATKLVASSRKGIASTVTFMRRSWGIIPVSLGGALISGLTATKSGYRMVTGFISSVIKKTFSILGSIRRKSTDIYDYGFQLLAKGVGKINASAGSKMANFGYKVTDFRERAWMKVGSYTANFGRILKGAFEHTITATIVPIWSSIVGVGFVVNQFTGGLVSTFASLIPVAGKYVVAALAGGVPAILCVAGVAMLGAGISLALKSDEIVNGVQAKVLSETIEEAIAISEIVDIANGVVHVEVEGNVTTAQATEIAEQHIAQELVVAEKAVRELVRPQAPRPQGPRNQNQSKNKKKK